MRNAKFDTNGLQIPDGESGKRRRVRKMKRQNTHLDIDFAQDY